MSTMLVSRILLVEDVCPYCAHEVTSTKFYALIEYITITWKISELLPMKGANKIIASTSACITY